MLNKSQLSVNHLIDAIYQLESTESTNAFLRQIPPSNKAQICITEQQTKGIGRRGNVWISNGINLCFSLQWRFNASIKKTTNLGLVASTICAQVLRSFGYTDIQVKWPNDLIYNQKKLGGILVEQQLRDTQFCVIIGIGINGHIKNGINIDQDWIDLAQINPSIIPYAKTHLTDLSASILNLLLPVLDDYQNQQILNKHWAQFDWVRGEMICIKNASHQVTGMAMGINSDGSILIETEQGMQTFYAGDISLRKIKT